MGCGWYPPQEGIRTRNVAWGVLRWEVQERLQGKERGWGRRGSTVSGGVEHRGPRGGEDGESSRHSDSRHRAGKEETGDVSRIRGGLSAAPRGGQAVPPQATVLVLKLERPWREEDSRPASAAAPRARRLRGPGWAGGVPWFLRARHGCRLSPVLCGPLRWQPGRPGAGCNPLDTGRRTRSRGGVCVPGCWPGQPKGSQETRKPSEATGEVGCRAGRLLRTSE